MLAVCKKLAQYNNKKVTMQLYIMNLDKCHDFQLPQYSVNGSYGILLQYEMIYDSGREPVYDLVYDL